MDRAGTFEASPFAGDATLLCVNDEEVRVYTYLTDQERAAVANSIDPSDPSKVGTALIAWAGDPRFWQSARMLILYLGPDQATEGLLTTLLGQPFSRGLGRGAGPGSSAC